MTNEPFTQAYVDNGFRSREGVTELAEFVLHALSGNRTASFALGLLVSFAYQHVNSLGASEYQAEVEQVYEYLRERTGKRHVMSPRAKGVKHLRARLAEGFTVADCKAAIDNVYVAWHREPRLAKYIRAQTIFQPTKFPGYLDGSSAASSDELSDEENADE
jgi:uncharacterized phage protein (TIGR02220 family)